MAGFDILNIVGDPWNDADSVFGGIELSVTDVASHSTSKFLEFVLNNQPVYTILKSGEAFFSRNGGASRGGMALIGNEGEMALTSQVDPNTELGAHLIRYYWQDVGKVGSDPDSVAVIKGMGNNRLSIESEGAIVHIAKSGRYEFETGSYPNAVQFVGYGAASSAGVPFLFNNHNQTTYADSVVQVAVDQPAQIAMQFGVFNGGNFTSNAYVDGSGGIYARGLSAYGDTGTFRGITVRATTDITARIFNGIDRDNNAFLGFGSGGGALDALIYRAGPNLFSIGGAASASRPAIKGFGTAIQGRLADDSDFCAVQGKLTTDQTATPGSISPNSTLTLYDAAGTAYLVPCIAA